MEQQKSRVVVVTGGSSGIGLAIVKRFLRHQYVVYNLDLNETEFGNFLLCDVGNHSEVKQHIADIQVKQDIDVLICNAGIHFSGNIEGTTEDALMQVFNINVKGAFSATQAVIPFMRANKSGVILYIASDQSTIAKTNSCAYNLSKHALASLAKTTALDYASDNIRANALCPGTIDTPLYQKAIARYCEKSGESSRDVHQQEAKMQPLGRIGTPEDVAAMAYFLATDEASFITGSLQFIDGGYTAQ